MILVFVELLISVRSVGEVGGMIRCSEMESVVYKAIMLRSLMISPDSKSSKK